MDRPPSQIGDELLSERICEECDVKRGDDFSPDMRWLCRECLEDLWDAETAPPTQEDG